MWQTKKFKSRDDMKAWLRKMEGKIQWQEVFINNCPAAVEYRKLRKVC
jgi:hypothetical protein